MEEQERTTGNPKQCEGIEVVEPTCDGRWLRRRGEGLCIAHVTIKGNIPFWVQEGAVRQCEEEDVTWTGPLDPPEAKPAPSEDEGEKWGKLLWEAAPDWGEGTSPWVDCKNATKQGWIEAARRFRDECIAPYGKMMKLIYRWASIFKTFSVCSSEDVARALDGVRKDTMAWIDHDPNFPSFHDQNEAVDDKDAVHAEVSERTKRLNKRTLKMVCDACDDAGVKKYSWAFCVVLEKILAEQNKPHEAVEEKLYADRSAPREEEGEKWGRQFHNLYAEVCNALGSGCSQWDQLADSGHTKSASCTAALLFRAKCLERYKPLMKALGKLGAANQRCCTIVPAGAAYARAQRSEAMANVLDAFAVLVDEGEVLVEDK